MQENSPFYGRYSWPGSVPPEVTIKRNCSYSCGTLTGKVATRYCTGTGVWNSTNFDDCPTKRTCDLIDFANVSNSNQWFHWFHTFILTGEICFLICITFRMLLICYCGLNLAAVSWFGLYVLMLSFPKYSYVHYLPRSEITECVMQGV